MHYRFLFGLLPALFLGACVPMTDKQAPMATPDLSRELGQDAPGSQLPEARLETDWWKGYGDAQLDALIENALRNAPALKSVEARYALANSAIAAAQSGNVPHVSADAAVTRERFSANHIFPAPLGGGTYTLYETGVSLDYTFDFWDERASRIRSAAYGALAQKAAVDAARLALAVGISTLYLSWHFDGERLLLLETSERALVEEQAILEKKWKQGLIDATALYAKQAEVAALRGEKAAVKRAIAGKLEGIGILGGFLPSYTDTLAVPKLREDTEVPLPEAVRLDLVAHRADVTVCKYIVLSKEQNIEQAKAQFYPNISLTGLLGFISFDFGKLLAASSYAPAGGAALSLPLFDGGAREANLQASVSDYNRAVNDYNAAVIKAANEVVGVLKRTRLIVSQTQLHDTDIRAKQRNAALAQKRFGGGLTDKLPYLEAKRAYWRGELAGIALREERAGLKIALINALGGGYRDPDAKEDAND
ncbi:efflux transporter outer membrane subunit [Sulfurimonas sp. HSL-1656]|uniref:efflux transporter outer membrane subunit n=1 Tax=Thiomicrolovo subterrani TaxID=3131934 RepID=UPI0031F735F7